MSYTHPIWDFNTYTYGYIRPRLVDNLSVASDNTPQYSGPNCWSPFGENSTSSRTFNFDLSGGTLESNKQRQVDDGEEMSEGIRALLEITRNYKNQSKFEDVSYTRSQDSMSEPFKTYQQSQSVSGSRPQLQRPQETYRIAGMPPASNAALQSSSSLPPNKTNYAMAVKKTLEPKKAGAGKVVYRPQPTQSPPKLPAEEGSPGWVDKNGRRTVNAKEMEGGPKINGRTIVNGVNLNTLKFVKPARQCPKWDKPKHRIDEPNCPLWHPRERCQYYPRCRLTAEVCGFGHPFCGTYCDCEPDKRSLQMNHLIRKDAVEMARQRAQNG